MKGRRYYNVKVFQTGKLEWNHLLLTGPNRHQFFSTNKQYVKIKLMQNETNRLSILVKTKYW